MNKREKKHIEKKRKQYDPGPITRRQQVAAIQQIKGQEIAAAVASTIRTAVNQEVETQLGAVKDTMFDLIDRVVDLEGRLPVEDTLQVPKEAALNLVSKFYCKQCGYLGDTEKHSTCDYLAVALPVLKVNHEGDGDDRQERAEGSEVQQDVEVVPNEGCDGEDCGSEDGT